MGNKSSVPVAAAAAAKKQVVKPTTTANLAQQYLYTISPEIKSSLDLVAREVLLSTSETDIRSIGQPDVCKHYMIVLVERFKREMAETTLRVYDPRGEIRSDQPQPVAYKYISDDERTAICNSYAFFVLRILQMIYICLCHMSPVRSINIPATGVDEIDKITKTNGKQTSEEPDKPRGLDDAIESAGQDKKGGKKAGLDRLIATMRKIPDPTPAISNLAKILWQLAKGAQQSTDNNDPLWYLSSLSTNYVYWYDMTANRLGFTKEGDKKCYFDFHPISVQAISIRSRGPTERGKQQPQATTNVLVLTSIADSKNQWFLDKDGKMYVKKQPTLFDKDRNTASFEIVSPEVILEQEAKKSQCTDAVGVKTGSIGPKGSFILSNPIHYLQIAMLSAKPSAGGYTYEIPKLTDVMGNDTVLGVWLKTFLFLLYADSYTGMNGRDGKAVRIEKDKPVWGFKQTVFDGMRSEYETQLHKLDNAVSRLFIAKLRAHPLNVNYALTMKTTEGKRYMGLYVDLQKLQDQMFNVCKQVMLFGAGGAPALVVRVNTDNGPVYRINREIINGGVIKLEAMYAMLRQALLKLYEDAIKIYDESINIQAQFKEGEIPTMGGRNQRRHSTKRLKYRTTKLLKF